MTNKEADASVTGNEKALLRIVGYLAAAIALSAGAGLPIIRIPALLNIFASMGWDGLTIDELQALGMLDANHPTVPTWFNLLGWIVMLATLGLLLWFTVTRRERDNRTIATDHAMFWPISALMGMSLALLFRLSDPAPRCGFVIGALLVAAWIHIAFIEDNFSRARNALLAALVGSLTAGVGYTSWFMAAVPIVVLGVVGFAVLLAYDLRCIGGSAAAHSDPIQANPLLEALSLYLSLAGLAVGIATLAG